VVPDALNFAIKFSSPKFTYYIFRDLYEWTDARDLAIAAFLRESWKMLQEVYELVAFTLRLPYFIQRKHNNSYIWLLVDNYH